MDILECVEYLHIPNWPGCCLAVRALLVVALALMNKSADVGLGGGSSALMDIHLVSGLVASTRTWLCRRVQQPCDRLVLQPTKMCFRLAEDGQSLHLGFSPYQWFMLIGDGKALKVAQMTKLARYISIPHSFLQVGFLFSNSSHCIHWPCFAWKTEFANLIVRFVGVPLPPFYAL